MAAGVPIRGFSSKTDTSIKHAAVAKLTVIAHFLNIPDSPLCTTLLSDTDGSFYKLLTNYKTTSDARQLVRDFLLEINALLQISQAFESVLLKNFRYPSADSPIANSDFFHLVSSRTLQIGKK